MNKTSRQWIKQLKIVCEVLDPDGWDRKNFNKSWREKISEKEFFSRMDASTCCHKIRLKNHKFCSCIKARPELYKEYLKMFYDRS